MDITGVLNLANGGTSANLTASNGGIFYSTASAAAILAGTSTAKQILQSGSSTTPSWSTATYPATTTVSQLLYSSSSNVVAGLSTLDNGVLVTSVSGVPEWLANGTANYVLTANSGAPPSWQATAASSVTFTGDSGTPFSGNAVTVTAGTTGLSFAASTPDLTLGGTLNVGHGGTGAATLTGVLIGNGTSAVTGNAITQYDVLVGGASNAISSISPSTSGYVLTSTEFLPIHLSKLLLQVL